MKSLQDTYAAKSICWGCGPANEKGLRIKSYEEDGELVARWTPEPYHHAFPGVLNGGIIGALLDCHSNWCASNHLRKGGDHMPCTVTAEFTVKLKKPTPLSPLTIKARVVASEADRATVEAEIVSGGKVTATCRGLFVAVKEGHPAYHRW
jgi:acyl-coenzyme A thioesterase PaaI-like protein